MATNYNSNIVTDGLVLCLDSRNKRSYPGNGSLWYDLSGNNYTFNKGGGTYANGCLSYNGGYSYAYENVANSVPQPTNFDNWTMEAFCRPTALKDLSSNCTGSYNMTLFSNAIASNNLYYGYNVSFDSNGTRLVFSVSLGTGPTSRTLYFNPYPKTAGEKLTVTAQYSYVSATDTATTYLYVDGNLVRSGSFSGFGDLVNTQQQFRIAGRQNHCTNGSFIGEFYTFKYYNRLLTPSEIKQNYNTSKSYTSS